MIKIMVGYIYLITDTTNNMKYTGKHHYNKEGELDPNYHGSGVIIKNIYKKRPETLKEVYLKTCYTQEELNEWEKYYIKFYNTLWPNGYNLEEGGRGGVPSEETRKKLSEAQKGRHHSEETKQKMSEARSGEKNAMFGKHLSDETKRKLREANKGKPSNKKGIPLSEETRRKISENHCDCSGEKGPFYGKHHSEESKRKMSLAKKGKPAHNKGVPMSEEQKKKLSLAKSKRVIQLSLTGVLIREWPSTKECGRNGFSQGNVAACCRGEKKSHKGFRWMYYDDYKEQQLKELGCLPLW